MEQYLGADWVAIPAIAILTFVVVYLWSDRVLQWLHDRSLGQREEVLRLLELMFVTTDVKKVTMMMVTSSFGLGALFFIALWPNFLLGAIVGSVVTIGMWSVPKIIIRTLWERRCGAFVDQMVDGMTLMANGVKAGLSVQQCMERVSENMPNPISQEFGLVLSQMRLGRGMTDALNELGMRVPKPDVQMFVTAINILSETGGNMAETFQTITYTIRERQKIEKKIEAMTAQGITQGIIITLVPFFLLIVFALVDPAYVQPLFTTTMGIVALLMMITLQTIGGLMIRKVVKINV
ncbi:MAG: type II secretion system F family protein [Bdellovibrionota bacterium]